MTTFDHNGSHFRLYKFMAECPAYRALTTAERVLLSELGLAFNGVNNGAIPMSVRDAARQCNIAPGTASAAFDRLRQTGFVDCMNRDRGFHLKTPHTSLWRLTWWSCNVTGTAPSYRFLK
ncbi:hypothetical protein [Bradyrhizobium sp. 76]|uniref:hypothetical protein n=1 Tax=Bradyrhizobium sp. 76 TaxID=2782680 RepID=UPI001FFBCC39|nr:hypothetical protein [Bradyrhizobium sp. 76]MCK1403937.1 hypothetical protein [Bradyrhizobium sp. 76]